MRTLSTLSNASGMNNTHRIHIAAPPRNGDKESTNSAPPITAVHTTNDHLALAKPKANALIATNHTINVIENFSKNGVFR